MARVMGSKVFFFSLSVKSDASIIFTQHLGALAI